MPNYLWNIFFYIFIFVLDNNDVLYLLIRMDKPAGVGIKEPMAKTAVKWSPHGPNMLAVGSAENFGVVGKGMTQIKRIEGSVIQTVASLEEKVRMFWRVGFGV